MRISDDALYGVQLGLYVIGYKEAKDDQVKGITQQLLIISTDQKIPTRTSCALSNRYLFQSKHL